jgi:Spy/CpxP family protein refolding chaperone
MNRFILSLAAVATVAVALLAFTAGDLALGSVAPAAAQSAPGPGGPGGPGGPNGRGNQRFAKMLLSLQPPLTEDQKNRIRAIMADARSKARALTDPQAKRDAMRGAFDKIRTVLTPAQQAKMKAQFDAFKARQNSGNHP